jgi:integrase
VARQALALGAWGEVSAQAVQAGGFRARARFRDFDGAVRPVERWAATEHEARAALESALQERARRGPHAGLRAADTFATAAELWLSRVKRLADLGQRSPGTVETYERQLVAHVLPALGRLRLQEVSTPLVDRYVTDVHELIGPATGRTCRSIVSGVMGLAVRHGAVVANPTRELERLSTQPKRRPRALTDAERARWFAALAEDEKAMRQDLRDLSAFLLATGLRIGEALAVVWSEVDLDSGELEVTSTLLRVTGRGLLRKRTKSTAGERVLVLPTWCLVMLRAREAVGVGPEEPIFGSMDGTFRDPRNVTRWLAQARERHGFESWATFHAWRKTTATVLDGGGATARVIADQLGHSRVSMTQDVYLGRRSRESRVVAALEAADPSAVAKGGAIRGLESDSVDGPERKP